MIPVIALVGRPNVGKSTLFNRLTRTRDALVANYPGLTRDRKYGEFWFEEKKYLVVDTGGITGEEEGIDLEMAMQSRSAIDEADLVMFMVDCRDGLSAADQMLAEYLRRREKRVLLVANKIDGVNADTATAEFHLLGLGEIHGISASHGRGVNALLGVAADVLAAMTADQFPEQILSDEEAGIKIAVVGRPNVGKSTLVNRMLGEDRVVVFDQPGTTRDSVYIPFERESRRYTLIDTAGVRKRKNISEVVEKFSIVKTLQAIADAHVVILVMDAREGVVEQDTHLLGHVLDAGRAVVIAINKWDGLTQEQRADIRRELDRRLQFIDFAEIHFISAMHGTGVGHLYESVHKAFDAATRKLQTPYLTRLLEHAVAASQPPLVHGRRIKLRYAHMGGQNPPIIVIHGNQVDEVPAHYRRYLENTFRRELGMIGTPIRIEFKGGENPYAGKANALTGRQIAKRRRLVEHIKKSEHKKKRKAARR